MEVLSQTVLGCFANELHSRTLYRLSHVKDREILSCIPLKSLSRLHILNVEITKTQKNSRQTEKNDQLHVLVERPM